MGCIHRDEEMSDSLAEKFSQDGFVVLEDFLNEEEIEELRKAGEALAESVPEDQYHVFISGEEQKEKDDYFLQSADQISYFFEASALKNGDCGESKDEKSEFIKSNKTKSLNKIGHGLHKHHPVFRRLATSTPVREICYRLGMQDPVILQSMYIFKNPKIGGEVLPHQDATYLYAEPPSSLVGFWLALDDATTKNGCLWFAPGSHRSGVHRRFIRNKEEGSNETLVYNAPAPSYPSSIFRPLPVKKGTCVLIHGLVVHRSEANSSNDPRHAFTFHVLDQKGTQYSTDNWLQLPEGQTFLSLYTNRKMSNSQ